MLLWPILITLGVASGAPLEPRALRHSIFMHAPGYAQNVFLKMQSYVMTSKLAFHNGDKPSVSTLRKARNNHYYWDLSDGETTLVTTDDYGSRFCLDAGSHPAAGNLVHVWQCYPGLTQQTWVFDGEYVPELYGKRGPIKLRDFDLCLDRNGGSPSLAKCSGSDDQTWSVKSWEA